MSEQPKVFSTKEVKARKAHKCCECHVEIKKCDTYQYSKGIWDEPASYKQCARCAEIFIEATRIDAEHFGDGVGFTDLREWFLRNMSRDYQGVEFLNGWAKIIGVEPEKLNLLLKIDLESK